MPGRIALVTGANAGIGQAIVRELAGDGYRVISSGRRLDAVRASLANLPDAWADRLLAFELDIADPESAATLLRRLPPRWREIDVLVNNAGHDRGGRRKFHEADPADFRDVVGTNLVGLMQVTHAVLGEMVARDRGHIVNIGSVQGLYCYPSTSVYTATKFAIHGFSECLRVDYARTGIRVTEILPGLVVSNFAASRWSDAERAAAFYEKFDAVLAPADVAAAVRYALHQPEHVDVAQVVVQPGGRARR